ncbi:MAG: cas4 [Caloramator sp.]|uniref:CRISPR-associated exonuclease Cas4 n=1 Tax=Caloramator proteoclasticus DSM 10124 TaxID=1121262 RepID=A0A1M4ZN84_9CLOT|nr:MULTISPECIES: CRISPR-associated protein Cas4 [Caloramator]MBZ4664190.1 cas4 [Caloramator sp.]SHF19478.1 CRISPR-associated exonuclease Cas4 [Caloramator proteoclasticus DSM 10124]
MEVPAIDLRATGVEINYLLVCKRKLWFYSKGLTMEHNSNKVEIGKQVHDDKLEGKKTELLIDETIRIDYIDKDLAIHEIKMSRAEEQATKYQILYYIYYLRQKGIQCSKGVVHYPQERRTETIVYDEKAYDDIQNLLNQINYIKQLNIPPKPEFTHKCKKCSYYELCFC